jgi:DNA-binding GntR family transcriptional regulator
MEEGLASENEWVAASADYVKPRTPEQGDAWAAEAAAQGGQGRQALRFVGEVLPPPTAASALQLDEGEVAVVRQRLITLDDRPVELADTYYPATIARATPLAEPRKIKGGAVVFLAELGHTAARVVEHVEARAASSAESELFTLGRHEPVMVIERLTLDSSGTPIQFDVMVAPAALRRLRYEMKVS